MSLNGNSCHFETREAVSDGLLSPFSELIGCALSHMKNPKYKVMNKIDVKCLGKKITQQHVSHLTQIYSPWSCKRVHPVSVCHCALGAGPWTLRFALEKNFTPELHVRGKPSPKLAKKIKKPSFYLGGN